MKTAALSLRSPLPRHSSRSVIALKLAPALAAATLCLGSPVLASAHGHRGYSHDPEAKTHNPRWMTALRDDVVLTELSIPRTHDSLSLYEGLLGVGQTQSMSLENQLESGIRALDIRCRIKEGRCQIVHGPIDLGVTLDDVFNTLREFLAKNPGEAVMVDVTFPEKKHPLEQDSDDILAEWPEIFWTKYRQPNSDIIWTPPPPGACSNSRANPRLGDIRGKIVLTKSFGWPGSAVNFDEKGGQVPLLDSNEMKKYVGRKFYGGFEVSSLDKLYDKWELVKAGLDAMRTEWGYGGVGLGSSATSTVFPHLVASGHALYETDSARMPTKYLDGPGTSDGDDKWPDFPRVNCSFDKVKLKTCIIAYEGINVLATEYLEKNPGHTGIVNMDFPGPGLIDVIIHQNDSLQSAVKTFASKQDLVDRYKKWEGCKVGKLSGWFSEEEAAKVECDEGYAVSGMACRGRYCDDVRLRCAAVELGAERLRDSPLISEEKGKNSWEAPPGYVVVGAKCDGKYCDNVTLTYRAAAEDVSYCRWSEYFSEEQGEPVVPPGTFMAGLRCKGKYCDDKSLKVCGPAFAGKTVTGRLKLTYDDKCLGTRKDGRLKRKACSDKDPKQTFTFLTEVGPIKDAYGKCITVKGGKLDVRAEAETCVPGAADQAWILEALGGTQRFVSLATGNSLGATGPWLMGRAPDDKSSPVMWYRN